MTRWYLPHSRFRSTTLRHLAVLVVGLLSGLSLKAQDIRDLVEAALDEQIAEAIVLRELPMREALAGLEQRTGLRFQVHGLAIDWMPYGEQTRLTIELERVSVRAGLTAVLDGLGLAMRVEGDLVYVEPAPWLDRLGRRLTVDEIGVLRQLAVQPWNALPAEAVGLRFRLPGDEPGRVRLEAALREAPAQLNALRQLETATQRLGWSWVPDGRTVLIYDARENVAQRLDRPLDVHYRQMPLDQLLLDLGRRAGVTVQFEPGALQRVDAAERRVDLLERGTTTRQVLELLSGRTGLWYAVHETGIVIGAEAVADAGVARGPRIVAILRVPVGADGTTIDYLLREDELPPEFAALKARKLPEVIELLRQRLAD